MGGWVGGWVKQIHPSSSSFYPPTHPPTHPTLVLSPLSLSISRRICSIGVIPVPPAIIPTCFAWVGGWVGG